MTGRSAWYTFNVSGFCPFDLCQRDYRAARGLPAVPATHVVKWPWIEGPVRERTYACAVHARKIGAYQATLGYRCGVYRVRRTYRRARRG